MKKPPATLEKKLLLILHRAFLKVRNDALGEANEKFSDLGDAFEILPGFLMKWEDEHLEIIRQILVEHQKRQQTTGTFFDYLQVLDMDDEHFEEIYGRGW